MMFAYGTPSATSRMLLARFIAVVSSVLSLFAIEPAASSCIVASTPTPTTTVTIAASISVNPLRRSLVPERRIALDIQFIVILGKLNRAKQLLNEAAQLEDRENDAHGDEADEAAH